MHDKIVQNPFIIITCALILGILIGKYYISYPLSIFLSLVCYTVYLIFSILKDNLEVTSALLIISLILSAALRYNFVTGIIDVNHLLIQNTDKIQALTGIITEAHYQKDNRDKYIMNSISAELGDTSLSVSGKVLISTFDIVDHLKYGDMVKIRSNVQAVPKKRNPGQFDYRSYLATKNVHFIVHLTEESSVSKLDSNRGNIIIQNIIIPVKMHCEEAFSANLNEETSSLLRALLLGEKQDLDHTVIRSFQEVGVVHVLAISGLHIGFIVAFVFTFFSILRLSYRFKIYGLIAILSMYVVLVQFRPSVLRASFMVLLFLIGKLNERKVSIYNIIFGSGFIILILDPRELFNPGFQFSFIAVLSIVYGYEKFNSYLPLKRILNKKYPRGKVSNLFLKTIWMPFLVSSAAVIGTLPLTIYYYGMIPALTVLSNLIVIPLIGLIVFLGIFLLIISALSSFFAQGIGNLLNVFYQLLHMIINTISTIPIVSIQTVKPSPFLTILLMLFLFLGINYGKSWARRSFIIIILCFLLFAIKSHLKSNDNLVITFLDVGQGDAAFLVFPNGNTMLIDAGNAHHYWDNGENTILPFLKYNGILHLNYLVGSHAHNDHIGGFYTLIKKVKVDTLVLSPYQYNSSKYLNLINLCDSKMIPIKYVQRGDFLFPDPKCRVYVLHPTHPFCQARTYAGEECNNSSLVIKVQYGENGILFSGDLERLGEIPVLNYASFLESEILKVSHHGSNTSSSPELLDFVEPIISVISVAQKNKFKHPSRETLIRLSHNGVRNYLTSREGAVMFEINETEIKKVNWRNE